MTRVSAARAFAALIVLVVSTGLAKADAIKLLVTSMSPPGSEHSQQFNDWAQRVNAASEGTLALEIRDAARSRISAIFSIG